MLFKKQSVFLFLSACLFCSTELSAKPHVVSVYLTKLTAHNVINEDPSRFYFSISVFPSNSSASELRVPEYPLHWLAADLPHLKNCKLWQGTVENNSSVTVVLSLMDQKIPLLETDDLFGVIQVEIDNINGKIISYWCKSSDLAPTLVEQPNTKRPRFIMYGGDHPYVVEFKVKVTK